MAHLLMSKLYLTLTVVFMNIVFFLALTCSDNDTKTTMTQNTTIALPSITTKSDISIEESLRLRRSVREYADRPLTLDEVGQILWAAQGITEPARGLRTAPSAGATYPLEVYLFAASVNDLEPGVYRYIPNDHALGRVFDGDKREALSAASLRQESITAAPAVLVLTGVLERTARRYGDRALRYLSMEAGHAAQNVYLQAVTLEIGTVVIGAFHDDRVAGVLELGEGEYPLYIMPFGKMK
jgi:SagB-type dehydrogenase family enzyme